MLVADKKALARIVILPEFNYTHLCCYTAYRIYKTAPAHPTDPKYLCLVTA
jgi:hypothetical protein